jgi:hypothetical protein
MAAYEPGMITAVYAHYPEEGGYGDLPLVCGGALVDADLPWRALNAYAGCPTIDPETGAEWYTLNDEALAYADFIVGVLTPFKHVHLPFEINYAIAQHPSRLCNQPWAADAKARVTSRARAIRDRQVVPA